MSDVLTQLQSELASEKVQNITIHQLAETAVRKMKGIQGKKKFCNGEILQLSVFLRFLDDQTRPPDA